MNKKKIDKKRISANKRGDFIWPIVKNSKVILDIGVQKGKEVLKFYKCSPNVRVFGFEPHVELFDNLKEKFPKGNFYNLAISNIDGDVDFYQDISHQDSSSLRMPTEIHTERTYSDSIIKVQSSRLDTWYKESGLKTIDFIWSDVEGSEKGLIDGGRETLKNTKYFYAEYAEVEYYKGQALLPELIELIESDFYVECIFAKMNEDRTKWNSVGDVLFKNKNL